MILPGPSTVLLTVFLNESSGLRAVYETRGVLNGTWIQKRVDYSSLEPHQVEWVFENSTTFDLMSGVVILQCVCVYTVVCYPKKSVTPKSYDFMIMRLNASAHTSISIIVYIVIF